MVLVSYSSSEMPSTSDLFSISWVILSVLKYPGHTLFIVMPFEMSSLLIVLA